MASNRTFTRQDLEQALVQLNEENEMLRNRLNKIDAVVAGEADEADEEEAEDEFDEDGDFEDDEADEEEAEDEFDEDGDFDDNESDYDDSGEAENPAPTGHERARAPKASKSSATIKPPRPSGPKFDRPTPVLRSKKPPIQRY